MTVILKPKGGIRDLAFSCAKPTADDWHVFSGTGRQGNILYDYVPNTATNQEVPIQPYRAGNPILPLNFFLKNVVLMCDPPEIFHPCIVANMRNAILARGIPALSGPTGRMTITPQGVAIVNVNMNTQTPSFRPNGWGRDHDVFVQRWLHSDLKDMAFFYNFKLFEAIVLQGELN